MSGRPRGGLGGSPLEKSLGSPSGREGVLEEALPSLFAGLSNEEKLPRVALAWRKVITADPTGRRMMGWEVLMDGRGARSKGLVVEGEREMGMMRTVVQHWSRDGQLWPL